MTTQEQTTEVIPAVSQEVPPVRSFIFPAGGIQEYAAGLLEEASRAEGIARQRIDEAEAGILAARNAKEPRQEHRWRLRKARRLREVERTERFCNAIREGYLPIPRMPAIRLDWTQQLMPPEILGCLAEAKESGLFDEFRIVDGSDAYPGGYPRARRGVTYKRDPILVGMVGNEMFPIGWWR